MYTDNEDKVLPAATASIRFEALDCMDAASLVLSLFDEYLLPILPPLKLSLTLTLLFLVMTDGTLLSSPDADLAESTISIAYLSLPYFDVDIDLTVAAVVSFFFFRLGCSSC